MIISLKPSSKLLEKYIEQFYVFTKDGNHPTNYVCFPHKNIGISITKGVTLEFGNHSVLLNINKEIKDEIQIGITGKYIKPVRMQYEGEIEEINIIFKPLGINHFLQDNLATYVPSFYQLLTLANWQLMANDLFKLESTGQRIAKLESFLLDNFREIDDKGISKAIQLIEDIESNHSIKKVAELCGVSSKSMERNFKQLMACTPSEYKRIVRFRHSLGNGVNTELEKKLIEIAYDSQYYDQSYFIREYKKLTGHNPKSFIKRVSKLTEGKLIWEIK